MNTLYYGDNLDVLREHIKDESVDLVYLDPPFNSSRGYNVLFQEHDAESEAQIRAFEDTWRWDTNAEKTWKELTDPDAEDRGVPPKLVILMESLRPFLGTNDMLAYLTMMAIRLVELRRVLKPTGSLYLHCDPTASHYLKLVLDAVFGGENFFSEIVWRRYGAHGDAHRFGAVHDVIFFYGKTKDAKFNKQFVPYTEEYAESRFRLVDASGRRYQEQNLSSPNPRPNLTYLYTASNGVTYRPHANGWKCEPARMHQLDSEGRLHFPKDPRGRLRLKMYLDESEGVPLQDVWTDVMLASSAPERLGYPTQKPVALLERILAASSNEGDVVLDPFCGCGTTIHAAQRLKRQWIGIDVTHLAVALIRNRLNTAFPGIKYEVRGEPADEDGARALAEADPYQFQWWALHLIGARPVGGGGEGTGKREGKKGKDRGIDGVIRFKDDPRAEKSHRIIISVKAGHNIGPAMVRDLAGTIDGEDAPIGVLFSMTEPTAEMRAAAMKAGVWHSATWDRDYQRVQLITVAEAFAGKRVEYPGQDVTLQSAPTDKLKAVPMAFPGMEAPTASAKKRKR